MQKKLPLINSAHGSETRNIINELIKLFNGMGYTYDEALQNAHNVLNEAQKTNNMNKDVQKQINTLIAESGTSDAEVVQSRIDAEGKEFAVLKDRLDTENVITMNYLVDFGINVKHTGAAVDGVTDDTKAIQDAVNKLPDEGGIVYLPAGDLIISGLVALKSGVTIKGAGRGVTKVRLKDYGVANQYSFIAHGQIDSRVTNVSLMDFTLDPIDPIPTDSAMRFYNVIRFNYVDNVNVERVESTRGHGLITMTGCDNFSVRDIYGEDNTDSVVTLFNGTKNGVIDRVGGNNINEVIDFFNNDNITCTNLYGETTNSDNEALDMSSSRNITIRDSHFKGFQNVALLKIEEAIPLSGYHFDNVTFEDFSGYGINVNLSSVPEQDTLFGSDIKVINCKFKSDRDAGPINYNTTRKISDFEFIDNIIDCKNGVVFTGNHMNTKFLGNKIKSSHSEALKISAISDFVPYDTFVDGNDLTLSGGSNNGLTLDRVRNPVVTNNTADATNVGLYLKDCENPIVENNYKIKAGSHGVYIIYTLIDFIDFTNKIVNGSMSHNQVESFGTASSYRSGIRLDLSLGTSVTDILHGFKMVGNRSKTPKSNTNVTYGLYFHAGSLSGLDHMMVKDNLSINVSSETIIGRNDILENSVFSDNIFM